MHRLNDEEFLVKHRVFKNTLILDLGTLHRVLSSAPRGGGFVRARSILNHQVPANPAILTPSRLRKSPTKKTWSDPSRYLGTIGTKVKAQSPIVGLMTAVPIKTFVKDRERSGNIWIECFCTVGVTNAVRAGEPACHNGRLRRCDRPGTINIILVTNATLTLPAMVGAVQVATESKTAVLIDENVRSASSSCRATGTGTDAIVIACRASRRNTIQYCGTHTQVGSMIGRLVSNCVEEGLHRSSQWSRRSPVRSKSRP